MELNSTFRKSFQLIDDVLDLTTGDARGVSIERERVDLGGLCRAAVETAQLRAAEKAQKLTSEIMSSTGFVMGDARRLRESIEHVLNNAITYSDRKGRILLEADGDEQQQEGRNHAETRGEDDQRLLPGRKRRHPRDHRRGLHRPLRRATHCSRRNRSDR